MKFENKFYSFHWSWKCARSSTPPPSHLCRERPFWLSGGQENFDPVSSYPASHSRLSQKTANFAGTESKLKFWRRNSTEKAGKCNSPQFLLFPLSWCRIHRFACRKRLRRFAVKSIIFLSPAKHLNIKFTANACDYIRRSMPTISIHFSPEIQSNSNV